MLIKAKILNNYKLNSLDGEIGKVKDLYFEDQYWTIRYLIANTGNWLTGRQVLLSPKSLLSNNQKEEYININLTKSQIESSPSLESDKPVSMQYQEKLYGYLALPMYGMGMGMEMGGVGATIPYIPIENDIEKLKAFTKEQNEWDPHLRSIHNVRGYDIQGKDDKIGHLEDIIIDDETWEIRYLIIDTQNWLPGKKILLAPQWIESVSWDESKLSVNFLCEDIKQSPEYTEETVLNREFETNLYQHYKREGYWHAGSDVKNDFVK